MKIWKKTGANTKASIVTSIIVAWSGLMMYAAATENEAMAMALVLPLFAMLGMFGIGLIWSLLFVVFGGGD